MVSSPSPRVARASEAALGREPPGRVFWLAGLGLQAPRVWWAPGTRWEATALTAWLRGSAKDRHRLSTGPHSPFSDWGWLSPPCLPPGFQKRKNHATSLKCYHDIISFSSQQASEVGLVLPLILGKA